MVAGTARARRRRVAAAPAACVLALVAACGIVGDGRPSPVPGGRSPAAVPAAPAASATPSPPPLPPVTDLAAAGGTTLDVKDADWVQVVDGNVWTTLGSERAVRLDPTTGAETVRVPTGGQVCTAMDQGFGSLWVAVCSTPAQVLRLDPSTGKVAARIEVPDVEVMEEGSVASGEGFVWVVALGAERTLVKIDPTTDEVVDLVPVEVGVVGARAGEGALWLTNPQDGVLTRRDVGTGAVVATIPTGRGARFFAVGEGAVWVQNNVDGTVSRVDPATNRVTATVVVDSGPVQGGDLAVGGGFVWARTSDALVAKIDPATATVVARYGPAAGSGSVAADGSAVWISAHDVDAVHRLPLP
ncbi:hypothetical protein [Oryzobacter terrae]|uniref:Vgb family protein n=1 Tax=Oryzobacter terrae TaxID=1620385 RepID=UPI00366C89E1